MKQYLTSSLILAVTFLMCSESATGPGDSDDTPLVLTTTGSSSVAGITRIPDKDVYTKGESVMIIVSPAIGYSFTGWSGDTVATEDTLTIIMNKSMIIFGNFINSSTGKGLFSISTCTENGTVVLAPSGGVYENGATVTITAQPDYGFTFSNWGGDLSGTNGNAAITVDKNIILTANFSEDPNAVFTTLHISPAPAHGKILLSPAGAASGDGYKFQPGAAVTITTEPDEGYRFAAWGGDFSDTDSNETSIQVTMDSDHSVSATFQKVPVGMTWTSRTSGSTSTLLAVVWTGSSSGTAGTGQLIAVGNSGAILTSPDGITWTSRNSPVAASLNAIAVSGSRQHVIVGNGGTVLTSPDGVTWTARSSGVTDNLYSIVWTGKQFVAVGGHMMSDEVGTEGVSRVITSADGATWTDRGSGGDGIWYSLVWTGSALYAAGFNNHRIMITGVGLRDYSSAVVYSSTDAASWTMVYSPGVYDLDFRAIARSDSSFIVIGRPTGTASTPYTPFCSSLDGTTWEDYSWTGESGYYGATWTGEAFVVVGDKGVALLITDPDPANRTYVETGTTRSLYGVAWTGGKLVAVGNSGTIMTSP